MNLIYKYQQLASKYHVKIMETDLIEAKGYYSPDLRVIFINNRLSATEQKYVLLHEFHHIFFAEAQGVQHLKSEYEANQFMIKQMLADYLNELDISMNELNYVDFMEQYQLHDEELVLDCINHYGRDQ